MKVALVTLGSAGDLYPFLAMGRALRRAGHDVHLLTQAPYQAMVEAEGLSFVPIASQRDHERTLAHPKLWHPIDGMGVLWRHLAVPAVEPTVDALARLSAQATGAFPLAVIASPLAVGARFAHDRWPVRVRWASAYTAPLSLREPGGPFFFGTHRVPRRFPAVAKSMLWRAVDRWKLDPMARPRLQAWQRMWGTPPLPRSIFGQWVHAPEARVGLYPPSFGAPPSALSPRPACTALGFPLYRPPSAIGLPEHVAEFVKAPGRLAVLYLGSAAADTALASAAADALLAHGYRVLHITPFLRAPSPAQDPGMGGAAAAASGVLHTSAVPLHEVLRQAALVVHHGGVGTLAEAWAAGVPQLLLPHAYDQFDNAERAAALGWATWLPANQASPQRLARALHRLPLRHPNDGVGNRGDAPLTATEFDTRLCAWFNSALAKS